MNGGGIHGVVLAGVEGMNDQQNITEVFLDRNPNQPKDDEPREFFDETRI